MKSTSTNSHTKEENRYSKGCEYHDGDATSVMRTSSTTLSTITATSIRLEQLNTSALACSRL